jgi:L-lysine exporter family protein LysE/ArgO
MLAVYFRAMVISLALVSSIGMQNIYAFNNAMSNTLRRALLVAGFIWIADTLLTSIAFLGMGALIAANQVIKIIVMGLGGLVVIWMGYGIVRGANAASFGNDHQEQSLKQ